MANQAPQHIQTRKAPFYWNWWRENPVEIILVVFILVLFFTLPRAGCGITEVNELEGNVEAPGIEQPLALLNP